MTTYDIVVSAENNPYQEWQIQLLQYSCMRQQRKAPITVAHCRLESELLLPGFLYVAEEGRLQRTKNYGWGTGGYYEPRNFIGALACVRSDADVLVLMDPDMIFVRSAQFSTEPGRVVLDSVDYMDPGSPLHADWLPGAAARAGIGYHALLAAGPVGGVPYVIHRDDRMALVGAWIDCLDACADPDTGSMPWLGLMWAFVFAALRLRFAIDVSHLGVLSGDNRVLPAEKSIIHYFRADENFDKRTHWQNPWGLRPNGNGTVGDRVRQEIVAAGRYYGHV
jgi:hypothetical protein